MPTLNAPLFGPVAIKMPKTTSHIKKGLWLAPASPIYGKKGGYIGPYMKAAQDGFKAAVASGPRGPGSLKARIAHIARTLVGKTYGHMEGAVARVRA
jgi:hypothetical protein